MTKRTMRMPFDLGEFHREYEARLAGADPEQVVLQYLNLAGCGTGSGEMKTPPMAMFSYWAIVPGRTLLKPGYFDKAASDVHRPGCQVDVGDRIVCNCYSAGVAEHFTLVVTDVEVNEDTGRKSVRVVVEAPPAMGPAAKKAA